MSSPALGGDLVLAARPVTPEAFAPYGRMVAAGDRVKLGGRGASILVALDPREVGPRRVVTLQRFVGARRMLVPLVADGFLLVVAGAGDPPAGPAAAYLVRGGTGVVLDAGIWHAGPYPLADGTVLEAVEVTGPADHVDRHSVLDAFGHGCMARTWQSTSRRVFDQSMLPASREIFGASVTSDGS